MTLYFVDSNTGNDANAGTSRATALATLATAIPKLHSGDSLFVRNTHSEPAVSATTTWATASSAENNPVGIYSFDWSTDTPTAANILPGAVLNLGSTGLTLTISATSNPGALYVYGLNVVWAAGLPANITFSSSNLSLFADSCFFDMSANTGNSSFGGGLDRSEWRNCKAKFGATTQSFRYAGAGINYIKNFMFDVSVAIPTNVFSSNSHLGIFEGCNFTGFGATSLHGVASTGVCFFNNCSFASNYTMASPGFGQEFYLVGHLGANSYAKYLYGGTELNETSVTRVGGASDYNATGFSKKLAPTANCNFASRLESLPMAKVYNGIIGVAKTITVYGVVAGGVLPNNNDIWLEVVYLGDAGDSLGTIVTPPAVNSGLMNPLYAGSPVASDTSTWNGGLSSPTPFKLTATVTPQQNGPITVRVNVAKASGGPYYIDQNFDIT